MRPEIPSDSPPPARYEKVDAIEISPLGYNFVSISSGLIVFRGLPISSVEEEKENVLKKLVERMIPEKERPGRFSVYSRKKKRFLSNWSWLKLSL